MTDVPLSFVAIVPARLASTRLPNKPLADIGGKPMVVRVAERAREAGATQVIVATDSPEVVDAVRAHGFEVMLTRADHPSGTDRLAEVAARLGLSDDTLVVNVQGDEPLIDPALIASVAAHLAAHPDCAIATAAHPITAHDEIFDPNVVKVVLDARSVALYFSRAPIPWFRDGYHAVSLAAIETNGSATSATATITPVATASDSRSPVAGETGKSVSLPANPAVATHSMASPVALPLDAVASVYRHIGIYAYRSGFLRRYPQMAVSPLERAESLEQLRAIWHGERIAVSVTHLAPHAGVDTPADLLRAQAAFAAYAVGAKEKMTDGTNDEMTRRDAGTAGNAATVA